MKWRLVLRMGNYCLMNSCEKFLSSRRRNFENLTIFKEVVYLWTKISLLMEVSMDKVTVFLGGYWASGVDPNAARMTYHFTHHVLSSSSFKSHFPFLHAHWPLRYVVCPLVSTNWGWDFTPPALVHFISIDTKKF